MYNWNQIDYDHYMNLQQGADEIFQTFGDTPEYRNAQTRADIAYDLYTANAGFNYRISSIME